MAKKPTITSITSGYASTNTLNDNFEALRDAFDNTLSLDGSTPNSMTSDLNLNNNDILNASRILVGGVDYIATALSYKNAAEAAQTAAETAQAAAELVYDNFDDRYLGSKASDPTLDNDGNALLDGALYYDTINTVMKFYDTSTSTWYRTTPTTSDQANIDIVAGNTTNINTVAGISSDVTTVAGISSDVTTVAADGTDIGTVATSISNVNTAATNISNINTVAGISANVTTVAGNTSNINTVATDISNVNTVAGQTTNLQNVTDNLTAIQNAATNATNAATSASNAATSETNAATSASNASTSETNAASSATSAAASAAAAAASADFFDDVYLGSKASDPSTDNDGDALNAGDLYFNTTSNNLKVYSGSAWQDAAVDSSGFVQTTGDTLTGNLNFGDSDKAIFGAGSDLQIYHDGSNSYISEVGTGDLYVRGSNFYITKPDGSLYFSGSNSTGEAGVYFNNSKKLATTSTGVDITGTLTSDGLTVEQNVGSKITLKSTDTAITASETIGDIEFYSSDASGIGAAPRANISVISGDAAGSGNMYFKTTTGASAVANRMLISGSGDISFYEDTGTTAKFFWDASAESLGIGTSSPSQNLEISDTLDATIRLTSTDNKVTFTPNVDTYGTIEFYSNDTSGAGAGIRSAIRSYVANVAGGQSHLAFTTSDGSSNDTERMRIDSSGNVGIGKTGPSAKLDVNGDIRLAHNNPIEWGGTAYSIVGNATTGYLQFNTASTERMRIDSSGNLLVGTTTGGFDGITLGSTGTILATRTSGLAAHLNRASTDGEIVRFAKDGTTVGSIRASGGDLLVGTGDTGLKFTDANDAIHPWNTTTGGLRDAAIDLGADIIRFKDLYLSGGVYLGGTGSANKLDDYEEGTWTPVLSDGTNNAGGYNIQAGFYTKIGREVFIRVYLRTTSLGSVSGNVRITGLPYTSSSTSNSRSSLAVGFATGLATTAGQSVTAFVEENKDFIVLYLYDATTGTTALQDTEWTADGRISITGSYMV